MAIGNEPRTAEAMREPQNRVSALMRSLMVPTGIVFIGPEDMKIPKKNRRQAAAAYKARVTAERTSMMLQGVVRVLQCRLHSGKGPLPFASLAR